MKFEISKIILWSKKADKRYREIAFKSGCVNIITGASRTGKSAIIPIIDYCLGAEKCTIPVDIIRDACDWFGILVELEGEQLLLCRKEPGNKRAASEMFLKRDIRINIPEKIVANTNKDAIKNVLNEIFHMTFLEMNPDERNPFNARPSYRDLMSFLFQPQNIITNSNVLFFKADTAEHRRKLINIFPYVLGAITPEILALKQILERKVKRLQELEMKSQRLQESIDSWKPEISKWISNAYEYGLTDQAYQDSMNYEALIEQLEEISKKDVDSSKIISEKIKNSSDEIIKLEEEEKEKSKELFEIERRYREMKGLLGASQKYDNSLTVQRDRLEIAEWLSKEMNHENTCPICGNSFLKASEKMQRLMDGIKSIERRKEKVREIPIVFERELQEIDKERQRVSDELEEIRKKIGYQTDRIEETNEIRYTFMSISRFLGKIETAVQTYKRIGENSQLQTEILNLREEVTNLKRDINEVKIKELENKALSEIQENAERIIPEFDTERPDDKIEFVVDDLTIKVKNKNGRDDYLWEIGSASNWLAYHISVLLGFHEFFQCNRGISVPNFLVIDQPSQVYFPQKLAGEREKDNLDIKDEDKEAVRKIFLAMSEFIKKSNFPMQIIVTEHAGIDIWGGIDNVNLVEIWRNDKKLVPIDWID